MKNKIAITTTSFAEYDLNPLALLKEKDFEVKANTFGRKLNSKEVLKLCSGCIGIVAGTEIYDKNILQRLQGIIMFQRQL